MKTNLLLLTDRWLERVKEFSAEAHKIKMSIPEEEYEMPTTKGEHSENLHGFAAGYSAARLDLLAELDVCVSCVGLGTTAPQQSTGTMRVVCWRCDGSGLESTWKNKTARTHPVKMPILPIVH